MKLLYQPTIISLLFILGSCQTISGFTDNIGGHLPVIGTRCENWQCVTEGGRKASEEKASQKNDKSLDNSVNP